MTNATEIWQVEVNHQVYEANVEELCQWIAEGALLPSDKVRRGNLRWREAGRIPQLHGFFNAKENGLPFPVFQNLTGAATTANESQLTTENVSPALTTNQNHTSNFRTTGKLTSAFIENQSQGVCFIHPNEPAKYLCDGCSEFFCNECPKSYGGSVKICPMCGAMCEETCEIKAKEQKNFQYQNAMFEGFGFSDFGNALAYPFRFKTSFIFGALMFMFFTLGQTGSALGGIVLFVASIFCVMLANTLTFGCLANTIENFSQGNTDANFMPGFDEFELWDDVIQPFFLSLATYIVSFGLFIALLVCAFYYAVKSVDKIESEKNKIVNTVLPKAGDNLKASNQTAQFQELTNRLRKPNEWQNGEMPDTNQIAKMQSNSSNEEAEFQKLEQKINESRKDELESAIGKSPEIKQSEFSDAASNLLRLSMVFSIPIFLALLWGLFYFPAACAVAGYTRSLTAVLNPSIGLDTIKRFGFNYAKILLMCFAIGVFSLIASFLLGKIFSPFDLPRMGNLPAKAVGSFFTFYFSIVFSVVLGSALYKCSDRFNFRQN